MPGQTKYFISNTNGFFVNWYSDITGVESHGQALKASGNSGDDAVYVGQGTKVDATGLTSTGGNTTPVLIDTAVFIVTASKKVIVKFALGVILPLSIATGALVSIACSLFAAVVL